MVENALSGKRIKDKYVWVIYENGLGPIKSQFKINIPMFLISSKVSYTGIALPKLETRTQATPNMSVFTNGTHLGETSVVGDMDRVMKTEFKYSYNDILMRAVFSTMLKTYAQYEAQNQNGYLGLATGLLQAFTTQADTRNWTSMPKDFQVARVKMPANKKLILKAGAQNLDVKLGENAKHSIVHVRIPTAMSKPSVSVINF